MRMESRPTICKEERRCGAGYSKFLSLECQCWRDQAVEKHQPRLTAHEVRRTLALEHKSTTFVLCIPLVHNFLFDKSIWPHTIPMVPASPELQVLVTAVIDFLASGTKSLRDIRWPCCLAPEFRTSALCNEKNKLGIGVKKTKLGRKRFCVHPAGAACLA